MKMIKNLLILSIVIMQFGCSHYIHTPNGHKYQVSAREFKIEKKIGRISRNIDKQLGITHLSDSLGQIELDGRGDEQTGLQIISLIDLTDSVYRSQYHDRDTLGETARYRSVFNDQMRHAVEDYASYLKLDDYGQVWITFFSHDGIDYFSLMEGPVLPLDADGYALYNTRIQIAVFDSEKLAKKVLNVRKMKKEPYYKYISLGHEFEMNYDGPLDYYRIVGKDSIQFIGRGYMDRNMNFYPYPEK